jgi:hypothetical protein
MSYEDITTQFQRESGFLRMGELISSSSFSLEEAMSSIELMEPKMDPGCGLVEKDISNGKLCQSVVSASLSDSGQCRAADILLGLVYRWLSGELYVQTVHSCIFMIERQRLKNKDLSYFCNQLLITCCELQSFMRASSVADDEDFIGYMFGFNDEVKARNHQNPQVISHNHLTSRTKLLSLLLDIIKTPNSNRSLTEQMLRECCSTLERLEADSNILTLESSENDLINASIIPSYHRNLLPAGPLRVVEEIRDSSEIYKLWKEWIEALLKSIDSLDECHSPFDLMTELSIVRRQPCFRFAFVRAYLYHRLTQTVTFDQIIVDWLSACNGESVKNCSPEMKVLTADLTAVLHRAVHTLLRSSPRQHRSIKKVLKALNIMQHRAWELGLNKSNVKGIWSFIVLIACTLLQINLSLNIELDLVDLGTREICLVLFLIEQVSGVKLFILNGLLGSVKSHRVDPTIGNSLRYETITSAIENSFSKSALSASFSACTKTIENEQLERIFELRSIPLRAFVLPKTISLDDFLAIQPSKESADECLQWIERGSQILQAPLRGSLIGTDISVVKKTVLTNKVMLLKWENSGKQEIELKLSHHHLVPCIALVEG